VSITYELSELDCLIVETYSGEVSIEDLRRHWTEMLIDKGALAFRRSLADLRAATLLFSSQELALAIKEVVLPTLQGRSWLAAIVVRNSAQLQLVSRFQGYAARFIYDAVFSDYDEAKRWILAQQHIAR
jgi:hypothetical protein